MSASTTDKKDWTYIQNFVRSCVTQSVIDRYGPRVALLPNYESAKTLFRPRDMFNELNQLIYARILDLSDSKLGEIMGYAHPVGKDRESRSPTTPAFICMTGYRDVFDADMMTIGGGGRQIMQRMVVAVVVCVVRDMILQECWQRGFRAHASRPLPEGG